ncbi:hypothetical protein C2G38_2171892 [Gigaspora rosea]|uniref:Uncharacterized protein n=1 Tax=Gigaspora rosea TaxID=44941 RepID=A0A397VQE8_9GLOM|nr:hypothetical protein C2G38_2171892 [Gigaspora rosea]
MLMLSPLEDIISESSREASIISHLQTIRSEFTQELVSGFKNMAETLNLDFIIDIPNSSEFNHNMSDKIYLDHDMYETIVFNLCKHSIKTLECNKTYRTWNGSIIIRLYLDYKDNKKIIVLEVSDTALFRVESQNSCSHEGTGIVLALVKQLITRYRRDIIVTSVELCINRQLYLEECSQWAKNNMPEAQFDKDQLSVDVDWSVNKVSTKEISSPSSTDNLPLERNIKYYSLKIMTT